LKKNRRCPFPPGTAMKALEEHFGPRVMSSGCSGISLG
jgi:hypothetical protein